MNPEKGSTKQDHGRYTGLEFAPGFCSISIDEQRRNDKAKEQSQYRFPCCISKQWVLTLSSLLGRANHGRLSDTFWFHLAGDSVYLLTVFQKDMMTMRLSQNQIDYIAFSVYKMLQDHPKVDVRNPDAIVSIVRMEIAKNLKAEAEIMKEAEEKLAPFKSKILREGADYQDMVRQGMQAIAKKKGVVI